MNILLHHWYTALNASNGVGLCLRSNNRNLLRQQLYAARAKANDQALESLSIVFPAENEEHLWIMKNTSQ